MRMRASSSAVHAPASASRSPRWKSLERRLDGDQRNRGRPAAACAKIRHHRCAADARDVSQRPVGHGGLAEERDEHAVAAAGSSGPTRTTPRCPGEPADHLPHAVLGDQSSVARPRRLRRRISSTSGLRLGRYSPATCGKFQRQDRGRRTPPPGNARSGGSLPCRRGGASQVLQALDARERRMRSSLAQRAMAEFHDREAQRREVPPQQHAPLRLAELRKAQAQVGLDDGASLAAGPDMQPTEAVARRRTAAG